MNEKRLFSKMRRKDRTIFDLRKHFFKKLQGIVACKSGGAWQIFALRNQLVESLELSTSLPRKFAMHPNQEEGKKVVLRPAFIFTLQTRSNSAFYKQTDQIYSLLPHSWLYFLHLQAK